MSGCVYKIICIPTGQIYVGQASDVKYKKGKPYIYGINGRWVDHVSSSKRTQTPLSSAICQYGKQHFVIEEIENVETAKLDECEAKWIQYFKSYMPSGLNVAKHSINRHHDESTLPCYYKDKVVSAIIRPIKRNGRYRLVYLLLTLKDDTTQRLCFGQNKSHDYNIALNSARKFVEAIQCPVIEENNTSDAIGIKYSKKLEHYADKKVVRIRITTASSLIAVYISLDGLTSYKDQDRICFGGKYISFSNALNIANDFITLLKKSDNCEIINDTKGHYH